MGIVLIFIFSVMTIMGVLSWWYAAHYNGLIGTTMVLSIISILGLLFSIGYVYKNGWSSSKPSQSVSRKATVNSSLYFAKKNSESVAAVKLQQEQQNVLKQLNKSYNESVGDVTFDADSKTYTVTPTKKKYVSAVTTMWKYPTTNKKSIASLSTGYVKMSKSIDKALKGSYTLQLKKSQSGPTILRVKDGKATVMNESAQ